MVIIDKFFNLKHFDAHFGCEEPDSNKRRGSDSLNHNVMCPIRYSLIALGSETIYFKKFGYVSN
jgi:hypothetical protein